MSVKFKFYNIFILEGELIQDRGKIISHFFKNLILREFITIFCVATNPFGLKLLKMLFLVQIPNFFKIIRKYRDNYSLFEEKT